MRWIIILVIASLATLLLAPLVAAAGQKLSRIFSKRIWPTSKPPTDPVVEYNAEHNQYLLFWERELSQEEQMQRYYEQIGYVAARAQLQQSQQASAMARQMAQASSLSQLYGSGMAAQQNYLAGYQVSSATADSTPAREASRPKSDAFAKIARIVLGLKVRIYALLSGSTPFQVYRELRREHEDR